MKEPRIASLDFLRGIAALSVAIPHFFMAQRIGEQVAETVSILGVEIFFVLSGYVLAPQIIFYVVTRPDLRNAGIFLVRRWMRTIPPYLIALLLTSAAAHTFPSTDFFRYATYLQNLFRQSNATDYFSIAWSLSVEEWFYLVFPPFFMALASILPRKAMRATIAGGAFILLISVFRSALGDYAQWGSDVRRVVIFRMDAIAWGFLLNLAVTRTNFMARITLSHAVIVFGAVVFSSIFLTLKLAANSSNFIEQAFPFYTAALGASAIILALKSDKAFQHSTRLNRLGSFLGRISYSTYLFHLLVLSALTALGTSFGWPILLAAYLAVASALLH
jgi:peptidoglycan/LPS O-acetylase OafA/YrhL